MVKKNTLDNCFLITISISLLFSLPLPINTNDILDKIIISLQLTCKEKGLRIWTEEESKQIDEGLDLFREWFMALWW